MKFRRLHTGSVSSSLECKGASPVRLGAGWLHVALAACVLLAPVALNGRPALFFDTLDYVHEGEATLAMTHAALPGPDLNPPTRQSREQDEVWRSIRASRSAAYGLLAYLTIRIGGVWLLAWVQALAASGVIYGFVAAVSKPASRATFWGIVLAVTLASGLPFYCGFAMPDVFAGIGILAVVALTARARRLTSAVRASLFLTAVACASMHTSHVLTVLALTPAAVALEMIMTRDLRRAARSGAWPLAVAGVALLMFAGFATIVRVRTGAVLRSPPFMSARLLTDGPGRSYLRKACAQGRRPFTLCDYKARRLTVGDDILWSRDKRIGVFATVDAATRTRLSEEDRAFAWAVVRDDPVGVAVAALHNVTLELTSIRIGDPLRSPAFFIEDGFWRRTALASLVPGGGRCARALASCRSRFSSADFLMVHWAAYGGAWVTLVWLLTRREVRRACVSATTPQSATASAAFCAILIVAAVVANAAICGVLSGPYSRYQARVAWLAVAAAAMLGAQLWSSSGPRDAGPLTPRLRLDPAGAAL